MFQLRRRRYRGYQPIAFPAWRLWEDRRVRTDDSLFAMLFAARIARIAVANRTHEDANATTVADLFSSDGLVFQDAFRVSPDEAQRRWTQGEEELCRTGILLGVASIDELLGASISLLRVLNIDPTASGSTRTGVSDKIAHLKKYGGLNIPEGAAALYEVCIAIRHSVSHHGSRQKPVAEAWQRASDTDQEWWNAQAGRPLPLDGNSRELKIDDRELLAATKVLDTVALELNKCLLETIPIDRWAWLIAREMWLVNPTRAGDPTRNVEILCRHARRWWRMDVDPASAKVALSDRHLRTEVPAGRLLASWLDLGRIRGSTG